MRTQLESFHREILNPRQDILKIFYDTIIFVFITFLDNKYKL